MVGIAADPVFVVDESRMDVLSFDKLGKQRMLVLQHDGAQTFQLGFLFSVDIDLIIVLQPSSNIRKEEFEVLVENRLRRDGECNAIYVLALERNFQIDMTEGCQFREEFLILVHVGRIQPNHCILLE